MEFSTAYDAIIEKISQVDPLQYAASRNFLRGQVTRLSPYISRAVVSLPMIVASVLAKYSFRESEKFIQELAWREYWQRTWEALGDEIFSDIKTQQQSITHQQMPLSVLHATTGITVIDEEIQQLYSSGYMHNHVRMYVSSIVCNIAKAHWRQPSQWMYYHLLDGDLASNSLSWQWIAGTFSTKKYYCNQDNINHYCNSRQRNTFLDCSYETLAAMDIPAALHEHTALDITTVLPVTNPPLINPSLPVLLYNGYNLDPLWHLGENANRILLLEPSHFNQFPVSNKVIDFLLALSKNIPGIQVFTGEFDQLKILGENTPVYFKRHPAFMHYKGIAEGREWLFPNVKGYYPSFSSYWKQCRKTFGGE